MKKLKIPAWALLKKADVKWVSRSRLGWLYQKNYLDYNLFTLGYYYSQIAQQYSYHMEAPKLKSSKTFDIQKILFGGSFNPTTSYTCQKRTFYIFKHWEHIEECLKKLSQERSVINPLLKHVLKEDLFPSLPLHYWAPLFRKGLEAIGEGTKL